MVALAWLIIMTLRLSPAATPGRATIAGQVVSDEFSILLSLFLYVPGVSDGRKKKRGQTKHWKKPRKVCYI